MNAPASSIAQLDLFRHARKHPVALPAAQPASAIQTQSPVKPVTVIATQSPAGKAQALAKRLARLLNTDVALKVHDNRSTMVSFRRQSGRLTVRLHHMFLEADEKTIAAIADYAGNGKRGAGSVLDAFIASHQTVIQNKRPKGHTLVTRGAYFELQEILNRVNVTYFDNAIVANIGWGRNGTAKRRRKRSVRLGVYDHRLKEIRIHPVLDKPSVPLFFVEFIVFHEMLHQLFPTEAGASRQAHHPPQFRARERTFGQYAAAMQWEKTNLAALLQA